MIRLTLLSMLLLALAAGCNAANRAAGAGGLSLDLTPERPVPGQQVTLVLRNRSDQTVGYNLCTSSLMRESGATWEPVPSDRVCTMELRMLDPGGDADFTLELDAGLPPGVYRFETRVELFEAERGEQVASESFRVGG